jgi:hypothetical protein
MATINTYDDGNLLEDVMLAVTNISPEDRPFMESIGRSKAIQPVHQWPVDTLDSRASAATLEGATVSAGSNTVPTRKTNYTQYCTKAWQVTNSEKASRGAGVDNMFMYQRGKKLKSLINSIEYDLINGTISAGTTAATRTMCGLINSISTNTSNGTGVSLTEADLVNLFNLAWTSGGSPKSVFVNGSLKKIITKFAGESGTMQKQISAEKKEIVNAVDFYVNDFTGRAEILLSRDMPIRDVAVIDKSFYSAAYLLPIGDVEVGQSTYGQLGALEAELTLENRAEAASARGYDFNIT